MVLTIYVHLLLCPQRHLFPKDTNVPVICLLSGDLGGGRPWGRATLWEGALELLFVDSGGKGAVCVPGSSSLRWKGLPRAGSVLFPRRIRFTSGVSAPPDSLLRIVVPTRRDVRSLTLALGLFTRTFKNLNFYNVQKVEGAQW